LYHRSVKNVGKVNDKSHWIYLFNCLLLVPVLTKYRMMKRILLSAFLTVGGFAAAITSSSAQCDVGETALEMTIFTDAWGYETYWELVPSGNACGDGTIASGGNLLDVGCEGAGQQDAGGNGYESNIAIESGIICLTTGMLYDLVFIDDWGDGGLVFEVYENGQLTHLYVGGGTGNVWTFEAGAEPTFPAYDAPCAAELVEVNGPAVGLDNTNAIAQLIEPRPAGGNCGLFGQWCEGGLAHSVWATFQAPESGSVVISSCNEGTAFDTQMALYQFEDCANYDTYELISANDDTQEGCAIANGYSSIMYASCLNPGEFYLIQIDGYYGEAGLSFISVAEWEGGLEMDAFVDNVNCPNVKGDNTGGISLNVYGTGLDYSVIWTGPNGYSGEGANIGDLEAGSYSAILLTSCGEMATGTFTVDVPEPLNVSLNVTEPTCQTSDDGSAIISASGATEPYTFFWEGPDGFEATGSEVSEIESGNYSVTITDENGCVFNQNVTVEYEEFFSFSLGIDTTICVNQQLLVTGPAGYDYEWQDGSNNQFFVVSGPEDGVGTYVLILTASNDVGCENTDAIIVTVDSCVGVEESDLSEISVYPVPASGVIAVNNLPSNQNLLIDIVDASGRLLKTIQSNQVNNGTLLMDISDLSSGMYLMNFKSDKSNATIRIVVE
jgi:hypothetical protein